MSPVRACVVEGCRNRVQHHREGLCDPHFRQEQRERQRARERRGIRETGQAREQGCPEVEITDGHMAWWVSAAAWERRGLFVRSLV